VAAQCRGIINLWEHNQSVGAQSICGGIINLWGTINLWDTINLWGYNQSVLWGHGMPCPTLLPSIAAIYCCHLLPFHAIPCPAPTMLLPATVLPATVPLCYHAMTRPHALPLPSHATAAICCYLLPPMPSHALPYHAAATMHHIPTMPHNTTMLPCHDPPHVLPPNSGNPHDGGSTVVEA
jgi:hypothetical protein